MTDSLAARETGDRDAHRARPDDISSLWWFWVPMPVLLAAVGLGAFAKNRHHVFTPAWHKDIQWYAHWFHGEGGVIEVGTAAALGAAIIVGVLVVRRARGVVGAWTWRWLVLVLAATVYFCGEEVSWGQQVFGWETPSWYLKLSDNKQRETNLHNIKGHWFNQKPRVLFEFWVLVGGILVPLYRRATRRYPDPHEAWSYWFWPTGVCTSIAFLAMLVKMPKWVAKAWHISSSDPLYWLITPAPPSETQEYALAAFLLVYFSSLLYRLRIFAAEAGPDAS